MNRRISLLNKFSLLIVMVIFFIGCDISESSNASLNNIWEVSYRYVELKSGSYGPFSFYYPIEIENEDLDSDGSVETIILTWFYEFQLDGNYNMYREYTYTDPGTQTPYQDPFFTSQPPINAGITLFKSTEKSGTFQDSGSEITISHNDSTTTIISYSI
ncbi:MAG: hypothetical protein KAR21_02415, partial [Spirochaetales bacterium]|nr:hypothetical protein [Spirochaetales bacterium]